MYTSTTTLGDTVDDFDTPEAPSFETAPVEITLDLGFLGAQGVTLRQTVRPGEEAEALRAMARRMAPHRELLGKFRVAGGAAPQQRPVATGTGAGAVRDVASGTAVPNASGVVIGPNDVGYIPTSALSTDEAKALCLEDFHKQYPDVDDQHIAVFDNRGGKFGLEAGGTNNYSAVVIKLREGAPGSDVLRTANGKAKAIYSIKWNRDGSIYGTPDKQFVTVYKLLAGQLNEGAPQENNAVEDVQDPAWF